MLNKNSNPIGQPRILNLIAPKWADGFSESELRKQYKHYKFHAEKMRHYVEPFSNWLLKERHAEYFVQYDN